MALRGRQTDHIACLSTHKGTHQLTSFWSVVLHTAQPAALQTYTAQQRERSVTTVQYQACLVSYSPHTQHSTLPLPPLLTTHLVSHLDQAAQSEFEYHAPLEGDKVPYIFKDEESRTVVVAVAEVGDYE